jgi:hypothetical protein
LLPIDTVRMCAQASLVAYSQRDALGECAAANGLEVVALAVHENHFAVVLKKDSSLCLAFRGTSQLRDWITNLNLFPTKCPWGWTHRGFASATECVWPPVQELLASPGHAESPLFMTGHSLGGAMATVAALKTVHNLGRTVEGLVTFGQPPLLGRSWNGKTAQAKVAHYQRYINSIDIVVTAPCFPYWGHGQAHYIDADGNIRTGFHLARFLMDAAKHGWRGRPLAQIGQHAMRRYLDVL